MSKINCFKEIKKFIKRNKYFIISFHKNPDGDAIASSILMAIILRKFNKKYRIICQNGFPQTYDFLQNKYIKYLIPEFLQIPPASSLQDQLSKEFQNSAAIVIDSSNLERVGSFYTELKEYKDILNIDHHPDNSRFGNINCIFSGASATSEIIYDIMKFLNIKINKEIAELLYISLATDTGFFSQQNTTKKSLKILTEILNSKVNIKEINNFLNVINFNRLALKGLFLSRVKNYKNFLVWSYISKGDFKKTKTSYEDTEFLINEISVINGIKVAILFKQISSSCVKVSFRSNDDFNVYEIAKYFGGGGHINAAGCELKGSLKSVIQKVVNKTKQYILDNIKE